MNRDAPGVTGGRRSLFIAALLGALSACGDGGQPARPGTVDPDPVGGADLAQVLAACSATVQLDAEVGDKGQGEGGAG